MKKAFTLIELLIVVAIIAILAAIAVPNFLEAQTRAKVSRAKSDMRSMAIPLEAYIVDNNQYPLCNNEMLSGHRYLTDPPGDSRYWVLERLSTPIAYITTSRIADPFLPQHRCAVADGNENPGTAADFTTADRLELQKFVKYGAIAVDQGATGVGNFADTNGAVTNPALEKAKAYLLYCSGPFRTWPGPNGLMTAVQDKTACAQFYDPTNGTVSWGCIWRTGGQAPGTGQQGEVFFRNLFAFTSK